MVEHLPSVEGPGPMLSTAKHTTADLTSPDFWPLSVKSYEQQQVVFMLNSITVYCVLQTNRLDIFLIGKPLAVEAASTQNLWLYQNYSHFIKRHISYKPMNFNRC